MTTRVSSLWKNEDWWAVWIGFALIAASLTGLVTQVPKVGKWTDDPLAALGFGSDGGSILLPLLGLMVGLGVLTTVGVAVMRSERPGRYAAGFAGVFVLATLSYWIANQANVKYWGLSYALWALLVGLLISNTVGTPKWLLAGAKDDSATSPSQLAVRIPETYRFAPAVTRPQPASQSWCQQGTNEPTSREALTSPPYKDEF